MKLQEQAQLYVALTLFNSFLFVLFFFLFDIMTRNLGAVARALAFQHNVTRVV